MKIDEYTISLTINRDLQHALVFLSSGLELRQLGLSETSVGSLTAAHVGLRKSKGLFFGNADSGADTRS